MSNDTPMYSEEYQVKVLSYMLENPQFRDIAYEVVSAEHFANAALQWYFHAIGSAKIPLSPVTLREELLKAAQQKQIRSSEVDKVVGYYNFIKQSPMPHEVEHIHSSFEKFIRTQAMKLAILDSLDLIKGEEWDAVIEKVETARNTGMDILTIGSRYFTDFEARLDRREHKSEDRKLSTGIPDLDALMYGGLKTKQMGLLVGGSGRGKSIFLEWLARVGILLGQQVVYYTMELSEEDIEDRFDSLFCHIRPQELKSMRNEVYKELHPLHEKFGDNLIIKEYPEGEASINTIKGHYKQLASIGVKPGLVIIDYLDLMKPHRSYNDINQEQKVVAEACRGMAKQFNTRVWSALQLNRSGLVQDTPDESGLAGSISRLFTADAVIIMAQTKEEREDEIMRLHIKKNRNGPSERTIKLATDFGFMTFYKGSVADTALQSGAAHASPDSWSQDNDDALDITEEELTQVPANAAGMAVLD